jgi:hypothetical protein
MRWTRQRERRVIPGYSLLLVCFLPLSLHTRPRVRRASGVPHALYWGGRFINASGASRREDEVVWILRHCERSEAIHTFFAAAMDCFAEPVIGRRYAPTRWLCAEHDRQLGGESPLSSLMVAKD